MTTKAPRLISCALGARVKLGNGRVVVIVGATKGWPGHKPKFRWVCEYLGRVEWLPGRWADKLGELEIANDQDVEVL